MLGWFLRKPGDPAAKQRLRDEVLARCQKHVATVEATHALAMPEVSALRRQLAEARREAADLRQQLDDKAAENGALLARVAELTDLLEDRLREWAPVGANKTG